MNSKLILVLLATLAVVAAGSTLRAAGMPDAVTLDGLSQYFEGVEFDHQMHTDLGEDCSVCHHHTTGTGTADPRCVRCHADSPESAQVACADCHAAEPFSAERIHKEALDVYQYHVDRPGLKGAYHWNCLGCHQRMDGPTACADCHTRTPEGDAFYQADAGAKGQGASPAH